MKAGLFSETSDLAHGRCLEATKSFNAACLHFFVYPWIWYEGEAIVPYYTRMFAILSYSRGVGE